MTKLKIWILATRPKTLPAAIAPVIIGTALAWDLRQVHWVSAFVCLFCALLLQICANLANDYFDGVKGTDTAQRKGPLRVTQAGLVTHRQMQLAIGLVIILTIISGLYLVGRGGWVILLIGILSIIFSLLYTAGPFPLSYLGLGDVFVFLFFGLAAVSGTYYVQTLSMNGLVIFMGSFPGLVSIGILVVNNLRDMKEDTLHNKKTLAVRWGKTFSQIEYISCLILASLFPLFYTLFTHLHLLLLSLSAGLGLWLSIPLIRTILTYQTPSELNPLLGKTSRLLFIYSLIFALAVVIGV